MSSPLPDDDQTDGALPKYFNPSATYVAPATGLLFSGFSAEESSLINFLPSRDIAEKLLQQYWTAVHPVVHLLHRPSFERQYDSFWSSINSGFEPPASIQAVVFAVLFSGAVSLPEVGGIQSIGQDRKDVVRTTQGGCEYALSRAHVLRTTKLDVIQAFVIYLVSYSSLSILWLLTLTRLQCAGLSSQDPTVH